jgi:hypothetical protein
LATVEIINDIEAAFGIDVTDEQAAATRSIDDLVELIASKRELSRLVGYSNLESAPPALQNAVKVKRGTLWRAAGAGESAGPSRERKCPVFAWSSVWFAWSSASPSASVAQTFLGASSSRTY